MSGGGRPRAGVALPARARYAGSVEQFIYGVPLGFRVVLAVPVGALLAAAAGLALTARGWRGAGVLARTHQVALFVGIGALTWFLAQWNLLGWQFP